MFFAKKNKWVKPFTRFGKLSDLIACGKVYSQDSLNELMLSADADFQATFQHLYSRTRRDDELHGKLVFSHSFNHILINNNLKFGASCFITDDQFNLRFPIGIVFAADDYFLRLTCNDSFLSKEFDQKGKQVKKWTGTTCVWPERSGELYPTLRYLNYQPKVILDSVEIIKDNLTKTGLNNPSFLSLFYSGIPYEDPNRLGLSANLVDIALTWAYLHEEGHYIDGHLHYMSIKNNIPGIDEPSLDNNMVSFSDNFNLLNRKAMERRADQYAFRRILEIFSQKRSLIHKQDSYFRENRWMLRMITVAACCMILVLHKNCEINGTSKIYPSPQTRIKGLLEDLYGNCFVFNKAIIAPNDFALLIFEIFEDLVVASDLLFSLSDFDDDKRRRLFEQHFQSIDLKSHLSSKSQPYYQHSTILFDDKIHPQKLAIEILNTLQPNGFIDKNSPFFETWFKESYEINTFMHEIEYESFMKKYRKMALRKGFILSADSDFT